MNDSVTTAADSMVANLAKNTGKSLDVWHALLNKQGFSADSKHGEIMKFLKGDAGVSHGYANLIALRFRAPQVAEDDALVQAQYAGEKVALLPIYNSLIAKIGKFGKDVVIAPKKSYVSLRRSKQFGLIQPSTKTRIDAGINLAAINAKGRLEPSGSFNAMVSHRVRIEAIGEVDAELLAWLRAAYDKA